MLQRFKQFARKAAATAGISLTILTPISAGLIAFAAPAPVHAIPVEDIPAAADRVADRILNLLKEAAEVAGAVAYKNGLRYYLHKLAYDTAVWIATGDLDQESLLFQENWEDFAEDLAEQVAGEFLNTLASENGFLEFDLCGPVDFQTEFLLNFYLQADEPEQEPTCSLQDIHDNFEEAIGDGQFLDLFAITFIPAENDLGSFVLLNNKMIEAQNEDTTAKILQRMTNDGFKDVTDKITGAVTTPGNLLFADLSNKTGTQAILPETTFTREVVADTIDIFTSTLASKLLNRYMNGLFPPPTLSLESAISGDISTSRGVSEAQEYYAKLNKPNFISGGTRNVLNELVTCPTDGAGITNCSIDEQFRIAIEQGLRVEEALEQGLLDGSRPFAWDPAATEKISIEHPEDGYGYRTILILKHHRIIPAGWQIAAEYLRDYGGGDKSLSELVAAFDQCGQGGGYYSPFCGLIDPDWVLKAPENFCDLYGYSDNIIETLYVDEDGNEFSPDTELIVRAESCVDDRTCIQENDDDSCSAYGYCYKEKPTYKFNGESCAEYYASCETFVNSDDVEVSWLQDTVNYASCDAENVGCEWYCTTLDEDGNFNCTEIAEDTSGDGIGDTVTLNGQAEECDESDAGCSEYLRVRDSGTNLLVNPGFEKFDGTADDGTDDLIGQCSDSEDYCSSDSDCSGICQGWTLNSGGSYEIVSDESDSGGVALSTAVVGSRFELGATIETNKSVAGRTFSFSFMGKNRGSDTCSPQYHINNSGTRPEKSTLECGDHKEFPGSGGGCREVIEGETDWDLYTYVGTFEDDPTLGSKVKLRILATNAGCEDFLIDSVQLSEGAVDFETPYDYVDYDGSPEAVSLTGQVDQCDADDVGCTLFTDVINRDQIPGKITNPQAAICEGDFLDPSCSQCLEETVGCEAFEEVQLENQPPDPNDASRSGYYCYGDQTISCDPTKAPGSNECADAGLADLSCLNTVSIIPDTGTQCTAEAVGCEQYTNLDVVAEGGEGLEYYTYIKQCVTEGEENTATYYTWEGSDTAGYQLVAYDLKVSNLEDYSYDIDGDGADETEVGSAPCTNLDFDDEEPPFTCLDDDGTGPPLQDDPATCTSLEFGEDPDCYQFYDSEGETFYRLNTRTITESAECHPLRNAQDEHVYYTITGESTVCAEAYAGCKEYRGAAGNNVQRIVNDTFEDETSEWSEGILSTEATQIGGHSLFLDSGITEISRNVSDDITQNNSYILSFWAMTVDSGISTTATFEGSGVSPIEFQTSEGDTAIDINQNTWQFYEIGPIVFNREPAADEELIFEMNTGSTFYFDNIVLETSESQYVIRDSANFCQFYEGCREYEDQGDETHYLKSFESLCEEDVAGCESFIQTNNNSTGYYTAYNDDNSLTDDDVIIPSDELVHLIYSPAVECSSPSEIGCMRLGLPDLDEATNTLNTEEDEDGNIILAYDQEYIINNPDDYDDTLCSADKISCEEYINDEGTYYFKNPGSKTCEYRVGGDGVTYGWFINGSGADEPDCPTYFDYVSGATSSSDIPAGNVCDGGERGGLVCQSDNDCPDSICGYKFQTGICGDVSSYPGIACTQDLNCFDPADPLVVGACENRFFNDEGEAVASQGWVGECSNGAGNCSLYLDPYTENLLPNGDMESDITDNRILGFELGGAAGEFWENVLDWDADDSFPETPDGDADGWWYFNLDQALLDEGYAQNLVTLTSTLVAQYFGWDGVTSFNCDTVNMYANNKYHSGSRSIKLGLDATDESELCLITAQNRVEIDRTKTYNVGGWVYANSGRPLVTIGLLASNYGQTQLMKWDVAQTEYVSYVADFEGFGAEVDDIPKQQWTLFQATYGPRELQAIPDETAFFRPFIAIQNNDTDTFVQDSVVFIDDVYITENDEYTYLSHSIDGTSDGDANTCNGAIETLDGCVPFRDISSDTQTYYSQKEFVEEIDNDLIAAGEIDAEDIFSNETCTINDINDEDARCRQNPNTSDTNLVLNVRRDRVCEEWLACAASTVITKDDGSQETACFELGTCSSLSADGVCDEWTVLWDEDELDEDSDLTFVSRETSPLDPDEIKNYSGFSKIGVEWVEKDTCTGGLEGDGTSKIGIGCSLDSDCTDETGGGDNGTCAEEDQVVQGHYPWSFAREVGDSGGYVDEELIPNGNFEYSVCTGWGPRASIGKPCTEAIHCATASCYDPDDDGTGANDKTTPSGSCEPADNWCNNIADYSEGANNKYEPWAGDSYSGSEAIIGIINDDQNIDAISGVEFDVNNVLRVKPQDNNESGVAIDLGDDIEAEGEYIISFDARYTTGLTENLDPVIVAFEHGNDEGDRDYFTSGFCVDRFNDGSSEDTVYTCYEAGDCPGSNDPDYVSSRCSFDESGLQFEDTWNSYILGPIDVEEKATLGTQYCATASGRTKQPGPVECTLDAECTNGSYPNCATFFPDTELLFYQRQESENNNFLLDNISLRPALEVSKEDGVPLVRRSCRLYPEDTSPSCDYYDDSLIHWKGLRGYCMEHDPLNPSLCITWFPLDTLSGEIDGITKEDTGYQDRTPLYSCLVAKGTANIGICTNLSGNGSCQEVGKPSDGDNCSDVVDCDRESLCVVRPDSDSLADGYGTNGYGQLCEKESDCSDDQFCFRGEITNVLARSNNNNSDTKGESNVGFSFGSCESPGPTTSVACRILPDVKGDCRAGTCNWDLDNDGYEEWQHDRGGFGANTCNSDDECKRAASGEPGKDDWDCYTTTAGLPPDLDYAGDVCIGGANAWAACTDDSDCPQGGGSIDYSKGYHISTRKFNIGGKDFNIKKQGGFSYTVDANPIEENIHISEIDRIEFFPGNADCGADQNDESDYGGCSSDGDPDVNVGGLNHNYIWMPDELVSKNAVVGGSRALNLMEPFPFDNQSLGDSNNCTDLDTGAVGSEDGSPDDPRSCYWNDYDEDTNSFNYVYVFWDKDHNDNEQNTARNFMDLNVDGDDPFSTAIRSGKQNKRSKNDADQRVFKEAYSESQEDGSGHGMNAYMMQVDFDDEGFVRKFKIAAYAGWKEVDEDKPTPSGKVDWSWGDKPELRFYLRDQCEVIGEFVNEDGDNHAWVERVSEGSDYSVHILDYEYETDVEPFGMISAFDPGTNPTQWNVYDDAKLIDKDGVTTTTDDPTTLEQEGPFVIQDNGEARAGSPYSCVGSCSVNVCDTVTIGTDIDDIDDGDICFTNSDCPGKCIGYGVCRGGSDDGDICERDSNCDGLCIGLVGGENGTEERPQASRRGIREGEEVQFIPYQIAEGFEWSFRQLKRLFVNIIDNGVWIYDHEEAAFSSDTSNYGTDYSENINSDSNNVQDIGQVIDTFTAWWSIAYSNTSTPDLNDDYGVEEAGDRTLNACAVVQGECQISEGATVGECVFAGDKSGAACKDDDDCTGYTRDSDGDGVEDLYCGVKPLVRHIQIDGSETGPVEAVDGEQVNLVFEAQVNIEQLPLTWIEIDWNGDDVPELNYWWNAIPLEEHTFTKVLTCHSEMDEYNGQYCEFYPQIRIHDGWGFCSGSGSDYRDSDGDGNECNTWTQYDDGNNPLIIYR